MIDKTADFFEELGEDIGVSIKIPRPSKEVLKVSALTNSVLGAGLVFSGALCGKKSLMVLGAISMASAALMVTDGLKK